MIEYPTTITTYWDTVTGEVQIIEADIQWT